MHSSPAEVGEGPYSEGGHSDHQEDVLPPAAGCLGEQLTLQQGDKATQKLNATQNCYVHVVTELVEFWTLLHRFLTNSALLLTG